MYRTDLQLFDALSGCFGNVYVDDGGVRCGVFAFQERKARPSG